MGYDLRLKGTKITDSSAPTLPLIDSLLPRSGALMLLDPTHPSNPWTGAAVTGGRIPNIALAQAQALIPAGDSTSLAGELTIPSQWGTGAGLAQKTAKGALHLMPSQVNGLDGGSGGLASVGTGASSSPFNTYMRGPGGLQNLYIALWGRVSRAGIAYTTGAQMHSRSDGSAQAYGFYNRAVNFGETQYPTGTSRKGTYGEGVLPTATGVPFFQDIHVLPTANSNAQWLPLVAGGGAGDQINKNAGLILYGYYVENLTVSGRTYAEVSKLAKEKYTRDVKTVGGRYYGDTYGTIA